MDKEIKDIAEDLSKYVSEKANQLDSNNQLQYYICGSVATMLLSNATEIQECSLDTNNTIELGTVKTLSENASKSLALFQREIGDLDIMNVSGSIDDTPREIDTNTGRSLSPFCPKMLRRVPDIENLFKNGKINVGNDTKEGLDSNSVSNHRVSRIKTKSGNEFYIASPESIIAHKLEEIIAIAGEGIINQKASFSSEVKNKYPKDIKDLVTSINGILKFCDKEKLSIDIREVLSEKSNSRFMQHQSSLPQILQIIDKDAQSFIETSGLQNEISLTEFSEVMNMALQQRREDGPSGSATGVHSVSVQNLGKETLDEQKDTFSKDNTEKDMEVQTRSTNKEQEFVE